MFAFKPHLRGLEDYLNCQGSVINEQGCIQTISAKGKDACSTQGNQRREPCVDCKRSRIPTNFPRLWRKLLQWSTLEPLIINQTSNSEYVQPVSANFFRELQYFAFPIMIRLDLCLQLQHVNTHLIHGPVLIT